MFFHMLSSITLEPVGQFFIQAQQRMQSSIAVATLPLIEMVAVGHTLAQVPQTVHVSSLVTGETAIGRAPAASYGKVPGIVKSIREPSFLYVRIRLLILDIHRFPGNLVQGLTLNIQRYIVLVLYYTFDFLSTHAVNKEV